MTKTIARAKKSGKEFEVLGTERGEVKLMSLDTREEKYIKESTFIKNYESWETEAEMEVFGEAQEVTEVVEGPQVINVTSDAIDKVLEEMNIARVSLLKETILASESVETVIAELAAELPVELELTDSINEALRARDNNRQCFKENENRFRNTMESNCAEDEKYLVAYVEKMMSYYKKYMVAKAHLAELKAKAAEAVKTETEQA